jgi:hypothetical protein
VKSTAFNLPLTWRCISSERFQHSDALPRATSCYHHITIIIITAIINITSIVITPIVGIIAIITIAIITIATTRVHFNASARAPRGNF